MCERRTLLSDAYGWRFIRAKCLSRRTAGDTWSSGAGVHNDTDDRPDSRTRSIGSRECRSKAPRCVRTTMPARRSTDMRSRRERWVARSRIPMRAVVLSMFSRRKPPATGRPRRDSGSPVSVRAAHRCVSSIDKREWSSRPEDQSSAHRRPGPPAQRCPADGWAPCRNQLVSTSTQNVGGSTLKVADVAGIGMASTSLQGRERAPCRQADK